MSALESLNVLNSLTKHKTPKRIRKERAKKTIQSLVRKPGAPKQPAAVPKPQAPKVEEPSLRSRNAATLRAADRMVSQKCKDLHQQVLELLRAQKEHRQPKIKRKYKLSYLE